MKKTKTVVVDFTEYRVDSIKILGELKSLGYGLPKLELKELNKTFLVFSFEVSVPDAQDWGHDFDNLFKPEDWAILGSDSPEDLSYTKCRVALYIQ